MANDFLKFCFKFESAFLGWVLGTLIYIVCENIIQLDIFDVIYYSISIVCMMVLLRLRFVRLHLNYDSEMRKLKEKLGMYVK